MTTHHNIEQRTTEWYELRIGKFSASSFSDFFMGESTAGYKNAIADIAFERITGKSSESGFSSKDMQRGVELEPDARESYEKLTFNKVHNGGIFVMDDWTCCSPDGRIGDKGLIEIKCPKHNTQMYYLASGKLPKEYFYQVHFQMYVAEREWNDFFSFHPDLKPLKIRVYRDETVITEIKNKIAESKIKIEELILKITNTKN